MGMEIVVRQSDKIMRALRIVPLLALGVAFGQAQQVAIADQPVAQPLRAENQSPVFAAHDVLLWAKLPGGIVDVGENEPVKEIVVPEGITVGEALTRVLAWQNKYFWKENDGVVNILPQKGVPTLLETNVPFYEWRSDEIPYSVVERLGQLPEFVRRRSQLGYVDGPHHGVGLQKPPRVGGPPEPPVAPQIFVRRNIALFDLLNEIVKSYPHPAIWRYSEMAQGQARGVTLSAR